MTIKIDIPENFIDVMDEPWATPNGELDLKGVLLLTIRKSPVKSGEDAERTLVLIQAIKQSNGHIELSGPDFDWMIEHLKQNAWRIWAPPDAAYLVQYLQRNKSEC